MIGLNESEGIEPRNVYIRRGSTQFIHGEVSRLINDLVSLSVRTGVWDQGMSTQCTNQELGRSFNKRRPLNLKGGVFQRHIL